MTTEEATSKFNINVLRDVFVGGDEKFHNLIRKLIKSFSFLHARDIRELSQARFEMHFVLVGVDATTTRGLQACAQLFDMVESSLAQKIVYVAAPDALGQEQLLFFQEIGVRYVASGYNRNEDVKEHLKRICLETHQTGSLEAFAGDVERAHKASDLVGLRKVIGKMEDLAVKSEEALRLLAIACMHANVQKKAETYLRRMLQSNPQNLWAANMLGKSFLRAGRIAEGVEILQRLSSYHVLNGERLLALGDAYVDAGYTQEAEDQYQKGAGIAQSGDTRFQHGLAKVKLAQKDFQSALGLIASKVFSSDLISFLNLRAIIAIRADKFDESVDYYQCALSGCGDDRETQAKLLFNMGLAYVRGNDLTKAQKCFADSLALGGAKFPRAKAPLDIVKQLIKVRAARGAGAPRDPKDLKELIEVEWETLY